MHPIVPIAVVSLMLLSACQQDRTPRDATSAPPSAEGAQPAPADTAPMDNGKSVMDYVCEGGHSVAIIDGGDVARVALADGRTIDLQRSTDQAPPLYAGEALEFAVTSNGGMLGQDEVGGFPCKAAV